MTLNKFAFDNTTFKGALDTSLKRGTQPTACRKLEVQGGEKITIQYHSSPKQIMTLAYPKAWCIGESQSPLYTLPKEKQRESIMQHVYQFNLPLMRLMIANHAPPNTLFTGYVGETDQTKHLRQFFRRIEMGNRIFEIVAAIFGRFSRSENQCSP
jgi:hypothetical protein